MQAPHIDSSFILGTAQLTCSYGILAANRDPSSAGMDRSAHSILQAAQRCGIHAVDTAPAYGVAEAAIGGFQWTGDIHTKLDATLRPEESLARSLNLLGRSEVDLLYVHDVRHFLRSRQQTIDQVAALRGQGARRLGISVYDPCEARAALELLDLDVVQIPVNPLDQRFLMAIEDGKLPKEGINYIGRSLLLQGLLALTEVPSSCLPTGTALALRRWQLLCRERDVLPGREAVAWARSLPILSGLILGAESSAQVSQLKSWLNSSPSLPADALRPMHSWPESDPRRWVNR